jgi:WD repeat-containing protein 11
MPPLRLLVTGLLVSAASPLTVIRMCPPLTTRNWLHYKPIMAGGTASGLVQIYNMATGTVDKELAVHSSVVRGG